MLPDEQQPMRIVTHTPEHLQPDYGPLRQRILQAIAELLRINSQITGFCTDPRSVVELSVDPSNQHRVFRSQYALARALFASIDECIQRWLSTGRITTKVPRNCIYNSPLLAAPK
jgi:hypothetical protein